MKGDIKAEPTPDMYRQTKPCSDCPFLKKGGVRHGPRAVTTYASYFTLEPPATFPCHQTRRPGQNNDAWEPWTEGQTICAGGLIFAEKTGLKNSLLRFAQRMGWYYPSGLRETETVCGSYEELVALQKEENLGS